MLSIENRTELPLPLLSVLKRERGWEQDLDFVFNKFLGPCVTPYKILEQGSELWFGLSFSEMFVISAKYYPSRCCSGLVFIFHLPEQRGLLMFSLWALTWRGDNDDEVDGDCDDDSAVDSDDNDENEDEVVSYPAKWSFPFILGPLQSALIIYISNIQCSYCTMSVETLAQIVWDRSSHPLPQLMHVDMSVSLGRANFISRSPCSFS